MIGIVVQSSKLSLGLRHLWTNAYEKHIEHYCRFNARVAVMRTFITSAVEQE